MELLVFNDLHVAFFLVGGTSQIFSANHSDVVNLNFIVV